MADSIRLFFLGTGAAVPTLRRALPTLAIAFPAETVLCDCSEGTQQRLMAAGLSPARIRHILISHLHGDHIFGLPGLLTTQHLLDRREPMHIWGPAGLRQFLENIAAVTGHRTRFEQHIHEWDEEQVGEIRLERFSFSAMRLQHSKPCYGFRICANSRPGRFDIAAAGKLGIPEGPLRRRLQEGEAVVLQDGRQIIPGQVMGPPRQGSSIAYCTDTRPCPAGIELARGVDVLLHDSTFSAELLPLAEETGHSTAAEAAMLARAAGARRLYLWHLSGRMGEADDHLLLEQARPLFPETYLPEDLTCWSLPPVKEE
ncbi:MAG TPA: ribonuclease Z [bacterium]|nr:ribonuclease Z [bacterium]HOC88581.1 ribonuclease Z [bacterium]HOZ20212.1 ribonuclease Z [bacterium]